MDKKSLLFWETTTDDYWFHFRDFIASGYFVFYGKTHKHYGKKGQYYNDALVLSAELVLNETEDIIIRELSALMAGLVTDAVENVKDSRK